ncbi:NnrS family protein [Thalassotalea litorea]|uniref:NnrS family protein n=1 Tax=Thalassotalea litorea TaxID=2020715 RepID=A0A5R9IH68_9GAMM|nr:NnrS family protein [Thalassotalea litorea]TLU62000.1 NnrS family protein [Thalassotalea litorea]
MLNITDNAQEQKIPAFFRLGFRPFFLSATIFSVTAIALWIAALSGWLNFEPYGGLFFWHAHEMLFGFVIAIIVGFLLTAVQTWTGVSGVRGWSLFGLFMVWLVARVGMLIGPQHLLFETILVLLDILFLPLSAYLLAKPIIKVRQYRNLFFVPVLAILALSNVFTHLTISPHFDIPITFQEIHYTVIMLITMIMVIMGGRVIPFFTANATKVVKRQPIKILEQVALGSMWLLALCFVFNIPSNSASFPWLAGLSLIAATTNMARCLRWNFQHTLSIPLLWSLHLAYSLIPISLFLFACHYAFGLFNLSSIIHCLTLGAMANLILAMISRVSLGHSGRPLQLHPFMPIAFLLLLIATLIRFVGVNFYSQSSLMSWQISALLWIVSFSAFAIIYWPVLTRPRVDGRPG